MPRPVRIFPVPRGFGEGRGSQPYFSAAALRTAIDRARRKPLSSFVPASSSFRRNSSGSAFAAAASFVDERLRGERRLRTIRIAQVAGAQRRLPNGRQADDLARHLAIRNRIHIRRHRGATRGRVSPAAVPSVARSAPYPARCIRGGCSRTNARRSHTPTRRPCASRAPRIFTRNAGLLVSHAVSSSLIHCMRTGRPSSRAIQAASQAASSAAVRPKPCGSLHPDHAHPVLRHAEKRGDASPHPVGLHVVRIDGHLAVRRVRRGMRAARTPYVPGTGSRTRLRSSLPRPRMPHRDCPPRSVAGTDCAVRNLPPERVWLPRRVLPRACS